MANIGVFTKTEDGVFNGVIKTLALNTKAKLVPIEVVGNGPDYRIFAGNVEIGAAWKRMSQAEKAYISVKLDDPSLPAPIFCSLHEDDANQHSLIWTRPTAK
jgi:uncharacterized protein (DUF736 family)